MGDIPAYNLENLEVVYAEQFQHIRSMVRSVLAELGVRKIRDTSSLEEAHDMIIDHPPDFVITDWGPEFDALKLVDWVRKGSDSPNRFTPIIVTSAFTERENVGLARDHGITEFIAKPLAPNTLYRRICMLIANARPFVECKVYFGPDRRRRSVGYDGESRRADEASI
ncbi:MAG: response regulator [Rhodospirillaceae bacterium]|jgi:PleD family two-component response regulator|nr:response regulator [Rhodospirillaceae bacterium]MBT3883571.1 response regulator [Rhodospirillaceae bacterium]MBT4115793.1 response regulator [Rhodospirillaceae bacterium]MBT4671376.1 response regulator [Rhodospirillaceae bacterium]MBT4718581.1 response regulator [Rhodospirillaceae bacterium]